jgi:hypothetical protein
MGKYRVFQHVFQAPVLERFAKSNDFIMESNCTKRLHFCRIIPMLKMDISAQYMVPRKWKLYVALPYWKEMLISNDQSHSGL